MGRRKGSLNKKTIERMEAERLKNNLEINPESEDKNEDKNKIQSVDKKIPFEIVSALKEKNLIGENENEFEEEKNNKKDNVLEKIKNNNKSSNKNKSKNNTITCERCGKEIFSEPRKIDTNIVTGMADYYRESKRYVRLCDECCKELSKIVDEWLWMESKGGNEELRKFEIEF